MNLGLPSIFSTLSTYETNKATLGLLMKLNDHWALHVYPVMKDQSHKNCVKTSYKKDRAPVQSNSCIVKKESA